MNEPLVPKAFSPVKVSADRLPGEALYDHPEDVAPSERARIWEILQVIMPGGELEVYGLPGEWGERFSEDGFAAARARALGEVAMELGEETHAITVLGREYRLEVRR